MLSTYHQYEVSILVNGRPISEYRHEGDIFVEGREGSQYEIEFKNRTSTRVLAVLSVDGTSVMDGKRATSESQGYVVGPQQSIRIPGWRLDSREVAAFKFGSARASYTAQMNDGDTGNVGVIGVRVFSEVAPSALLQRYITNGWPCYGHGSANAAPVWVGGPSINGMTGNETVSGSAADIGTAKATFTAQQSYAAGTQTVAQAQALGTAFGAAQGFATTMVEFARGVESATMLIFYDEIRGLRARGIVIPAPKAKPSAFADGGCVPPPGWAG